MAPPPNLLPHMGAIGATQGSATNNLYSSPKKLSTLYTTWLFYLTGLEKEVWNLQSFGPYEQLWIPGP